MKQKEGPSVVRIPEQVYNSCVGCKWYRHKMVKSGRLPMYRDWCEHPEVAHEYSIVRGASGKEIPTWMDKVECPPWCPARVPTAVIDDIDGE